MPPKKKTQSIQTKLNFRPSQPAASSPKTLFTVESPSPLRPHAAILQMQTASPNRASEVARNLAMLGKERAEQGAAVTFTDAHAEPLRRQQQQQQQENSCPDGSLLSTTQALPTTASTATTRTLADEATLRSTTGADHVPSCCPSHASISDSPSDSSAAIPLDTCPPAQSSVSTIINTTQASRTKDVMANPFLSASSPLTPLTSAPSTLTTFHIPKYMKTIVHISDSDDEGSDCPGEEADTADDHGSVGGSGGSGVGDSGVLSSVKDVLPRRSKGLKTFSSKCGDSDYREMIANHLFKRTVVNGTVYEYIPSPSMSALFPPSPESDSMNQNDGTLEQGQSGRPRNTSSSSSTGTGVALGKRKAEDELPDRGKEIHGQEKQRDIPTSHPKARTALTLTSSRDNTSILGSESQPFELDSDSDEVGRDDNFEEEEAILSAMSRSSQGSHPPKPSSQPGNTASLKPVPSSSSSSSTVTTITTATTTTSIKKPGHSFLDMMATPRGTQPMPRTAPPRDPKMRAGYESALKAIDSTSDSPAPALLSPSLSQSSTMSGNKSTSSSSRFGGMGGGASGSSIHSPIGLSRSDSNQSDDGFFSSSSRLDRRIAPRDTSLSQELSPPRMLTKQSSFLSGHSASGGGRTLPATLTGGYRSVHQPASSMKPSPYGTAQPPKPIMSGIAASFLNPRKPTPSIFESAASAARGGGDRSKAGGGGAFRGPGGARDDDNQGSSQGRILTPGGFLLSDEQQYILNEVVEKGRSIFFTGSAGTGKSVLLKEIIARLQRKHGRSYQMMDDSFAESTSPVAVTASTGIAACNIGGCTLHSFAGVGLGQESVPVLMKRLQKNRRATMRWRGTRVLIIDEISMIEAEFLDKLEAVARDIRRSQLPWGGIQLILTGDFFQLPPVSKGGAKFSFEAQCWKTSVNRTIQLKQVFRQKDPVFANVLNEIRVGKLTPESTRIFSNLSRELKFEDGIRPTELFPLRAQVDEANSRMLAGLSGKTMTYVARDRGPLAEKMETNCIAPTQLHLKINAQVMLLRNQDGGEGGLVNGTLGVVIGFVNRPADNGPSPSAMMGGLGLGSLGAATTKLVASEGTPQLNKPGEELPLVKFRLENGQFREMVIGREEWRIELPTGELQGARVQIPLGLAWSLSIHKSQGQTLPKVRVDLARVFEKGQAYVALSRATTLEGLQVLNFKPAKVMAHPKVVEFYDGLQVVGQ